jgi:hypothetical protein
LVGAGGSLSLDQIFKSAAAHLVSPLPFSPESSSDELTAAAASLLSCLAAGNNLYTNTPSRSIVAPRAVLPTPSIKRQASNVSSASNNSSNNPMIQSLLAIPQNQLTAASVAGRVMELATDRNGSRLLQKLLTQVNLNQIYFENILKELLKELRSDSEKNKSLSFFGFITSKIQNIFR